MQLTFRTALIYTCLALYTLLFSHCGGESGQPRVLIFNKSEFYVHECMPAAVAALEQVCQEQGWQAEVTDDAEFFSEEKLRRYAAVVFLNTAGDVLNPTQEIEFERYIQAGGGFVGIHTALDTEHNWPWYGKLTGARFDGLSDVQNATISVVDNEHPATRNLDATWQRRDEWFNLRDWAPENNVLLELDETTYQGGNMGTFHPVAWYRDFDGGRAFITAMGHTTESYAEPALRSHLAGGLQYAIGNNAPLKFAAHRAPAPPKNASGFVKTSLVCNLYEPMEMEMLPNGKILFIERRGAIKLYDPANNRASVVDELEVYIMNEEGLLGLAIDPLWEQNHWIYLYYAPKESKKEALQLSRFVFDGDKLDRSSEKVLFEIPTDRSVHNYHAGGSLAFDADGLLYLATGDNTDHYDDGYTSIDERPGKSQYDSQKSASNSMDLRGKILRIKPMPDGTYNCPAGNLYTEKETADASAGTVAPGKGRPEIFVMGCRNPFRISIDRRRRLLIWGEPGPDAGVPDPQRGPEGYDEINVARTAGFYGWPYVVGNNKPYRDFNFETGEPGPYFDPKRPVNNSPNNTGEKVLPPARLPLVWYPFKSSTDFPLVANGTRCAMAGPAYYADQYPEATRFPESYDGKIIIYDWMRNWMLAIGLDSLDQLTDMQPIAQSVRLARPVDMFFDKNGALWLLEYGTEWYAQNPDACLSRIDYIRGSGQQENATAAAPDIWWDFGTRNRSFYQPGKTLPYKVMVADPLKTDPAALQLNIDYHETDQNPYAFARSYRPEVSNDAFTRGQALVDGSDCKSCHALDRQVNGPSFLSISERYDKDPKALSKLTQKIIKGGSGNWGDRAMSAHPQLTENEVSEMLRWILSLRERANKALPVQGRYTLPVPPPGSQGIFVFSAYHHRAGYRNQVLRPTFQQAEKADSSSAGLSSYTRPLNAGTTTLLGLKNNEFFVFKQIDLRGVREIALAMEVSAGQKQVGGGAIELRLGAPDGPLAATAPIPAAGQLAGPGLSELILRPDPKSSLTDEVLPDVYVVVKNEQAAGAPVLGVDWVRFVF